MPKRRLIQGILAVGILAALIFALFHPPEPSYNGKSLSRWLDGFCSYDSTEESKSEAAAALRNMGTNALPYLLQWIRYEPSLWQKNLASRIRPDKATRFLAPLTVSRRRALRAFQAELALRALGPIAKPAIPELVRLVNDTNATYSAEGALRALVFLGEDALAPVTQILTNTSHRMRGRAAAQVSSMRYLGTNQLPLVPILIRCAEEPDNYTARAAIASLGDLGLQPELVLPVLTNKLTHPRWSIRESAIRAIPKFHQATPAIVGSLVQACSDPDRRVRDAATNALRQIAPEALTNAPAP